MSDVAKDVLTLTVNGQTYEGWTDIRVTRSLDHCAADFDISVSERWAAGGSGDRPWQIKPFDPAVLAIDGEPILTGYVDVYAPSYDQSGHTVRIQGRAKTEDLIDCMPDIKGGQFSGYTIDRIARALAAPFGITVIMDGDPGAVLPDAHLEKTETAYAFLEKLCRVRRLLACDDERGNLVLTTVGKGGTAGALVEGQNIRAASAKLAGDQRFSDYVVLSQSPLSYDGQDANPHVIGKAKDAGVPRFRRFAEMAETPGDNAIAAQRALWRAKNNFGKGTEATITVRGWRQPDGKLWKVNTLVPVTSARLQIDRQMLIGKVTHSLDDQNGRQTQMVVAPPEAYEPAPDAKKKKHKKGSSDSWASLLTDG